MFSSTKSQLIQMIVVCHRPLFYSIYFARAKRQFEWQVAPQLGIAKAQQKMLRLLGKGNIPGGLDARLKANLNVLGEGSDAYIEMLVGLKGLATQVRAGNIIKNSNY